jgi:hypothetical protein
MSRRTVDLDNFVVDRGPPWGLRLASPRTPRLGRGRTGPGPRRSPLGAPLLRPRRFTGA